MTERGPRLVHTHGAVLAKLTDRDLLYIATGLINGTSEQTEKAAFERRLAGKTSHWAQQEKIVRNVRTVEKSVSEILKSDPSVLTSVKSEEYLPFLKTLNELRKARARSQRYFRPRIQTRAMTDTDYRAIDEDRRANNPPLRTKILEALKHPKTILTTVAGLISVVTGAWNWNRQPDPPQPLLRDQAAVQPVPNFAPTAPQQVQEARDLATIAVNEIQKPEIFMRVVGPNGEWVAGAHVSFDGQTVTTNGAGGFYLVGETPIPFNTRTKGVLTIKLPDGRTFEVEREFHGGFNSNVLKRHNEFIDVPPS